MNNLSNEERKTLAGLARIEIRRWSHGQNNQYMVDLMNIAINALEQSDVIGKPVAWLNDVYLARGVVDGEAGEDDAGPGYIPVYRHPQNATPTPNPQIDNDGWIEWGGGDRPVGPTEMVDVRFRNGEIDRNLSAGGWNWGVSHDLSYERDIIAYRVIENDGSEG